MIEKFFENVLELKNIPRQGWKEKLGIDNPESVADHSYSTATLSMILSDMKGLDSEKIIRMALLHDLAESIIGDITPDHITKNQKIAKENHAIKQILKNLPNGITESYFEIWNDYQKKLSKEAILLHEIDKLEMAFQAKFYQKKDVSREKLKIFFDTAKMEIDDKNLRDILSNIIE